MSVLRDVMCVCNTAKSRTGKRRSLLAWRYSRLAAFRFYCVSFSNVFGGSSIPLWYKVTELSISRQLMLTLCHQREWDLTGYWSGTAWQMAVIPVIMKVFPLFEQKYIDSTSIRPRPNNIESLMKPFEATVFDTNSVVK